SVLASVKHRLHLTAALVAIAAVAVAYMVPTVLSDAGVAPDETIIGANHSSFLGTIDSDLQLKKTPTRNNAGRLRPRKEIVPIPVEWRGTVLRDETPQKSNFFSSPRIFSPLSKLARLWHRGPPSSSLL